MKLEDIGFYTLSDARAKQASVESPLWRCELLVTGKCNFQCSYCRGTRGAEISLEYAKHVVDLWADDKLKNIRFSGGEPTCWIYLRDLIRHTAKRKIEHVAISTNGSASMDFYKKLLDDGVNDFSISLDACCASQGNKLAGNVDVWDRVVENIGFLASKTYVTVGTVLLPDTVKDLEGVICLAKDLGVADIRIISAAQWADDMKMVEEVRKFVDDPMPILRYRARNIVAGRYVRGIGSDDNHRCPLVLDDMAIKGDYHYPCIIYLREGGDPIGRVGKNMRKEREGWYVENDTYKDPICNKNCLDICIDYNNKCGNYKAEVIL